MNSSWTDRIKQIEIHPPEKGWDKIAVSLDEDFIGHEFPVKLYNFEASPSANAWSKIEESLSKKETPAIPLSRGGIRPLFIRYAMAACLIGLISFAALKFFSVNKIKVDVAVASPTSTPQNNLPADSNSRSNTSSVQAETERDGQALEESKHTYARLDLSGHSLSNKISVRLYNFPAPLSSSLSEETTLGKNPEIQYSHRAAVNDSPEDKDVNRYLMFKDSEGRFIKISKKLTSLFCCVSGEEQDENCNDQLKKWREKIASSSFIPSPDNFMDILDLVSSLQDNRN
jgi:hypothetical protein